MTARSVFFQSSSRLQWNNICIWTGNAVNYSQISITVTKHLKR